MQCKSCNTELPKKAKVCPRCGALVDDRATANLKILAIVGIVIAMIGSMLPFVQNTGSVSDAYSFMNIDISALWYIYLLLLVGSILLVVAKREKLSIITTSLSGILFIVSFVAVKFRGYTGRNKYSVYSLTDLLSNGNGEDKFVVGCGLFVIIIGIALAIAGCFIDIMKYFKKDLAVDKRFLSNSINRSIWTKIYYHRGFYVMFLPVFIMVILFFYWPMLGCRFAFTKYVIRAPYYVGLYHFNRMFTNDVYFWRAFRNTLVLSLTKLILNTGMAVIISLLLNEIVSLGFKKTVQTIVYLPHFMSWVVVASVFKMILDPNASGVINSILLKANIISDPIYFLGETKYWRSMFYIMNIWKDTGWGTILFLATLSGISPDLYEAAQIDGANRWNRLIHITLPALANTIITVFILNLAKVMNLFESVFVTMNDAVVAVSDVLQTYIYAKTFGSGNSDYGYSTAVGLFKSFVGMILVLGCNWASKKVRGRGIV
ncbi:MAG: ABC transporter permease subunit [Clostridia bacterium]|nr:ABC transporter permease subunit [Clostridia bacterium]